MPAGNLERVREIFLAARGLSSEERAAFLKSACGDDAGLREDVEQLLAADAAAASTVERPESFATRPPSQIGPYTILGPLGEGGMGVVYKAEQRHPIRRIVAIKVIRLGFDSKEVIARFESERQALARMDHPNVARALDTGTDERGRPYFVMEYVPGTPITKYADENRLTIQQRLELMLQVCDAIGHAHAKAIIHRDIKAGNVLAYTTPDGPTVKVIDFGVAKALTLDRLTDLTFNTAHGQAIGTYESMSPEQADGSPDIDTRTDVYSLGVLLYEMLSGSKPFDKSNLAKAADVEIRRIIREDEPPRPSTQLSSLGDKATKIAKARQVDAEALTRQLQSELDWIPLMAIRKQRERRYATPQELAGDIRNYLEGKALIAAPDSRAYRFKKLVRQNRGPIAATLTVLAVLVLGIAAASYEWFGQAQATARAERATTQMTEARDEAEEDFGLARKAMQTAFGEWGTSGKDSPSRTPAIIDGYVDVYRQAVAKDSSNHELLMEYVKLLRYQAQVRKDSADSILQKAIQILDQENERTTLNSEDKFLLATLCFSRSSAWEEQHKIDGKAPTTLPTTISETFNRAYDLSQELIKAFPADPRFVELSIDLLDASLKDHDDHATLEVARKKSAILNACIDNNPGNVNVLAQGIETEVIIAKLLSSGLEKSDHFHQAIRLYDQFLATPETDRHKGPAVGDTHEMFELLVQYTENPKADISLLRHLLNQSERQGRGELLDTGYGFFIPEMIVLPLQRVIAYKMLTRGEFSQTNDFVHEQLEFLKNAESRIKNRPGSHRSFAENLLRVTAAGALMRSGNLDQAIDELLKVVGSDSLKYLETNGDRYDPKVSEEQISELAAAFLIAIYHSSLKTDLESRELAAWVGYTDRTGEDFRLRGGHSDPAFTSCLQLAQAVESSNKIDSASFNKDFNDRLDNLENSTPAELYSLAKTLALVSSFEKTPIRQKVFEDKAVSVLHRLAKFGNPSSEKLRVDPEFLCLRELREFQEILKDFDKADTIFKDRLASEGSIPADNTIFMEWAAMSEQPVRISGRIERATRSTGGIQFNLKGNDTYFSWSDYDGQSDLTAFVKSAGDFERLTNASVVFTAQNDTRIADIYWKINNVISLSKPVPLSNDLAITDQNMIRITDVTLQSVGKRVRVQGIIQQFDYRYNGDSQNPEVSIFFVGGKDKALRALVAQSSIAAFNQVFAPSFRGILAGATVRISGIVDVEEGNPVLMLSDPKQIEVIAPGPNLLKLHPLERPNDSEVISARDTQYLATRFGEQITIKGQIYKCQWDDPHTYFLITFENDSDGLMILMKESTFAQLDQEFKGDVALKLQGKMITARGKLVPQPLLSGRGRPVVTIAGIGQLSFGDANSGTFPAQTGN